MKSEQQPNPLPGESAPRELLNAFPAPARDLSLALEQETGLPALSFAIACLVMTGASLGNRFRSKGRIHTTYPNLYLIMSLAAGGGKGLFEQRLFPITAFEADLIEQRKRESSHDKAWERILRNKNNQLSAGIAKEATLEDLLNPAGGSSKKRITDPLAPLIEQADKLRNQHESEPKLVVGNLTGASMRNILSGTDDSLLLYNPDARAFLRKITGKQDDLLREFLLCGFSNDHVRNSTVTGGAYKGNPVISQILMTQPDLLSKNLSGPEFLESGLAGRYLMLDIVQLPLSGEKLSLETEKAVENWGNFLHRLLQARCGEERKELQWLPETEEVFDNFGDECARVLEGADALYHDHLVRSREMAVSIATGLWAAEIVSNSSPRSDHQQQSAMRGCQIARFLFNRKLAMLQEVSRQNLKQLRERLTDLLRDSGGNLKLSRLKDRHNIDQSTVYRLVSLYPGEFEIYHKRNASRGPIPEFVALRAFPDRQVNGEACA